MADDIARLYISAAIIEPIIVGEIIGRGSRALINERSRDKRILAQEQNYTRSESVLQAQNVCAKSRQELKV